jgi:hypothetical protein
MTRPSARLALACLRGGLIAATALIAADAVTHGASLYLGHQGLQRSFHSGYGWRQPYRLAPHGPHAQDPLAPRSSPRLVILGDEATRASAVTDPAETFAGLLGAVNAAVDGFGIYQMQSLYAAEVEPARPWLVGVVSRIDDLVPRRVADALMAAEGFDAAARDDAWHLSPLLAAIRQSLRPRDPRVGEAWERTQAMIESQVPPEPAALEDWAGAAAQIVRSVSGRAFVALLPPIDHVADMVAGRAASP